MMFSDTSPRWAKLGQAVRKVACAALALAVAVPMLVNAPVPLEASDHVDSPRVAHDVGADLGDLWAFLDPNDNSRVVMILSTRPFIISSEAIGQAIFDHEIRYRFEIENTGDARPDRFINVTYSKGVGRFRPQVATITLPSGDTFRARTTPAAQGDKPFPPVLNTDRASRASFFAGSVEDPFFMDNTAANRFVLSSLRSPGQPDRSVFRRGRDTYAGFNTLVTVVSVPAALLRGNSDQIGINAVVQRRRIQTVRDNGDVVGSGDWVTVDRAGTPLVNNGLIPADRKNEYNGASTEDDANGTFSEDIVRSIRNFGTDDAHVEMLLDAVQRRGDILRLNLAVRNTGTNREGGFPNGRRLQDDIADAVFTLLNNGIPLGDNVPSNDRQFRTAFPFVADPFQPFPPGDNPEDGTRL